MQTFYSISQETYNSIKHIAPSRVFAALTVLICVAAWAAVASDSLLPLAIPLALLGALLAIADLPLVLYALFFSLPLSFEVSFSDSFKTDAPSELLTILVLLGGSVYFLFHKEKFSAAKARHLLPALALLHLFWIGANIFFSTDALLSFKFFLAKAWYLGVFGIFCYFIIQRASDFKPIFWCVWAALLGVTLQTIIRQSFTAFDFEFVNKAMMPFFPNHVNYAVMIAVFMPYLFALRRNYRSGSLHRLLIDISIPIFFAAIILSYTRAAYVALMALPLCVWLIRRRWMGYVLAAGMIAAAAGLWYYAQDYRYLQFAPDFEQTIHHKNFADHLEATYEGRDVSFMERVHRWIAGIRMAAEKPLFGFGTNTFSNTYQNYTSNAFSTYMSDNEERSTVHNYYLLTAVEQGIPGLFIFLALLFAALLVGQNAYARLYQAHQSAERALLLAAILSLLVISINLLVGDMIETDEVGSFFFLSIALIGAMDVFSKQAPPKTKSNNT